MREQVVRAGEKFILAEDSPDGRYSVNFEDDGDTGYFYALDIARLHDPIVDSLHIYNTNNVVDRDHPSRFTIIWSHDGLKSALLINDFPHAAFDFSKREGYCRTNHPNFPDEERNEWRTSDHSWSENAVKWLTSEGIVLKPVSTLTAGSPTEQDLSLLRQSITLAHEARAHHAHPFGSLIADASGQVLLTARNNAIPPKGDPTQHAERLACSLAGRRYQPDFLSTCTLYTSCEPCPMCAAAIYWTGIRRLVYALPASSLYALTEPGSPSLHLSCRELLAQASHPTEIHGPFLEQEALQPHLNFWTPTS